MKNTILKDGLALWNQEITKQQESDFHTYMQHLLEKNKVMNLTNITEENEIYTKHFWIPYLVFRSIPFRKTLLS